MLWLDQNLWDPARRFLWPRELESRDTDTGWKIALVLVVFVLVFGIAVTTGWMTIQRNQAFSASLATAKQISFQTSQGVNDINDLETIRRFGQIVQEGQWVEAHHSYPTNRVRFWFNDHRHTYRLGQDAYAKDEFWLEVETGDNLNNWLLKQFRSPTMGAWLSENITDYAHAGLRLGPE